MTELFKPSCIFFKGFAPCKPHKQFGVVCSSCPHYCKRNGRVLIIKLGAAGDVVRTTCILHELTNRYQGYEVWWITDFPQLLPIVVHVPLKYELKSLERIKSTQFDVVYNLDKDPHACALADSVNTPIRHGFTLINGLPSPVNEHAQESYHAGIFDDFSKTLRESYPAQIHALCNLEWKGQDYILDDVPSPISQPPQGILRIGLNTGSGKRWSSRLWPVRYWTQLAQSLQEAGSDVILLGGPDEDEQNKNISRQSGVFYPGTFGLTEFVGVVNSCHVVVTAVTMALHIAVGLKKRVVLFNNVFNPAEFELYGRGMLIQPEKDCTCYYGATCTNPEYSCMDHLTVETVLDAVKKEMELA